MGCKKNRSKLFAILVTVLSLCGVISGLQADELSVPATPSGVSSSGDDLYHKALEAYLDGNYDQSILLAAQSLQQDPTNVKSRNLLGVLTSEKEKASKTVIWLPSATAEPGPAPGFAVPVPTPDLSGVRKDMQDLQTKLDRFEGGQTRKNQEMSGQMRVIQEIVRDNSDGQYEEVKKAQIDIVSRLEKIESRQGQNLRWLYILCGASVLISAAAIWRGPKAVKRS